MVWRCQSIKRTRNAQYRRSVGVACRCSQSIVDEGKHCDANGRPSRKRPSLLKKATPFPTNAQ